MNSFFNVLDSAYQLHYYQGFRTYLRKPFFSSSEEHELVRTVLDGVCLRENYHLLETSIEKNHLRLLLSLKPDQRVSRAVQMIKGNISREYGLIHANHRLWAKGYFAQSSGKVNLEAARRYIENQASHHGYQGDWCKGLKFRNENFASPAFNISHSLAILDYHLVLVTDKRVPIFDEAIAPRFFEYVMKIGVKHQFVVDRMTLLPDHLHLLIQAIPNVSVEECVLALMNNTQQWMTKHYVGVLKETGGWNVWQPSFYAGTVGDHTTAQVKRFLG
ncbi:MAG TPA: IS200/IS605 family transposase [Pyrinomonadaceae bacterium]|jgi:putative transposase|nr:IS200/IS605 family transposase [Pyrinomonadaceae bacterium]